MEKVIGFSSWSELLKAIPEYERLGFECEVRGWEGMQYNKLTIKEEDEYEE